MNRVLLSCCIAVLAWLLSVPEIHAQAQKEITNSIGMKLVLIPKGTFKMGSQPRDKGSEDDELQHEVTITRDYYLGVYEVTQEQYQKVMGKNPSYFQGNRVAERHPQTGRVVKEVESSNHPVESISWEDAVEFCERLSSLPEEKAAGRVYRLPTEAEWENACRAGTTTAYSFKDGPRSLDTYAIFRSNSGGKTHAVGRKKPNAWGLYDIHGNVWEWCSDWYGEYQKEVATDPLGPREGTLRVSRGGSWRVEAAHCRSANRNFAEPKIRNYHIVIGFRVALSPSAN